MNDTMMRSQGALLYLTQVAEALADVVDSDRAELLDEVQQHLFAVAESAGDVDLQVRLGPAADYAAELRTSAGLAPAERGGRVISPVLPERLASVWSYLRSLRPAWWAVRGYLVTGLILTFAAPIAGSRATGWHPDVLAADGESGSIPGAGPYTVLAIVTLIIGSVLAGRLPTTRPTWLINHALNLAAIGTVVLCPMWWAGPSLYTFYRGRYGL